MNRPLGFVLCLMFFYLCLFILLFYLSYMTMIVMVMMRTRMKMVMTDGDEENNLKGERGIIPAYGIAVDVLYSCTPYSRTNTSKCVSTPYSEGSADTFGHVCLHSIDHSSSNSLSRHDA